ncbi:MULTISPECIES: hypothetical protein [unclassified Mesorhizobium]|uniref:hypothetical protein n=1 Tax=unclassified Mesorhizobium TaxID=325217 RepID=UPI001129AB8C|nr:MULTISPECIES: hypothetical protein [unclassified Mesorhizobium]MBZ9704601.1 hypothetical protein [Mesorhizobium sp. CO1-1-3]MBZ9950361.1 hypothetical protein [Mesorhizobium sp. BR1-1-11]TPI98016.1 hypothetical protein FJ428_25190 [Mesorhizobium sp. B2-8-1]
MGYRQRHSQPIALPVPVKPDPDASLSGRAKQERDARLAIVAAFENFSRGLQLGYATRVQVFTDKYNAGSIAVGEFARAIIPSISKRSLARWQNEKRKGRADALAHDPAAARKGTGVLESAHGGAVRMFILGQIANRPHLCADDIRTQCRAEFGDTLTVVSKGLEKTVPMPPVRTFQHAIKHLKVRHKVELLKLTKPTYQCSLFVNSDDDHTQILAEFEDAMAGYAVNRRGLSGVIAGAPQIPVLEITADDIPLDRPRPDTQYDKSANDLYNQLSGQFTSIEKFWAAESLKPIVVNADIAADGAPRGTSNDFLQVSDPDIAQYLLTIRYRQNRKGGTQTIPVSRRVGLKVAEGDWITLEGSEWMINKWDGGDHLRVTLSLSETGADIYDDGDIEPGPIVVPPSPPINPSILTTVQNFRVEVGTIAGAGGQEVPALRFAWDPPNDPTIIAVRIFYYRDDIPDQVYQDTCDTPEDGIYITSKNVSPGVFYTARATITTVPDRFKTFTPWLTTADVTGNTFYPIDLDQFAQDVKGLLAFTGNAVRDVLEQLQAVSTNSAGNFLVGFSDKQELRRELRSTTDDSVALFREEITVATGPGSAIVTDITTLQTTQTDLATGLEVTNSAVTTLQSLTSVQGDLITSANVAITALQNTVNDPSTGVVATASTVSALATTVTAQGGSITSQGAAITALQNTVYNPSTGVAATAIAVSSLTTTVTAQGGTIAVNSSAITALQASYGDVSAGATFRMGTGYTPAAGWSSRSAIENRVTSGSTFHSSGFYLEATASASRIVMDTDQLVIMTGGAVTALFDSGTAFIANARIRNLTAGNISAKSLDANVVLQNGTVITDLIAGNAITDWDTDSFFTSTGFDQASFVTRCTITVNNTGGIPVLVFVQMNSTRSGGSGTITYQLVRTVSGVDTVIRGVVWTATGTYEPVFLDAGAPAGTFTYRIDEKHVLGGGAGITLTASITASWWKK